MGVAYLLNGIWWYLCFASGFAFLSACMFIDFVHMCMEVCFKEYRGIKHKQDFPRKATKISTVNSSLEKPGFQIDEDLPDVHSSGLQNRNWDAHGPMLQGMLPGAA